MVLHVRGLPKLGKGGYYDLYLTRGGIPLVSAPWEDAEGLFEPGKDFLQARDGNEMARHLRDVLREPALARSLAQHGRRTILERHTCAHRVAELLAIAEELGVDSCPSRAAAAPGEPR